MKVINDEVKRINNSSFNLNIAIIESDFENRNRTLFVILPTLAEASKYYDALINDKEDDVLFFPVDETNISSLAISSFEFKYERINTLVNLLRDKPYIVVTNILGYLRINLSKDYWQNYFFEYLEGKEYKMEDIRNNLVSLGYRQASITSGVGEFSYRGSIIDFYPISSPYPIRLDFFDTELESIKYYDPHTQKSISKLEKAFIIPYSEIFFDEKMKDDLIEKLTNNKNDLSLEEREVIENDISNLELRKNLDQMIYYISFFDSKYNNVSSFSSDKKLYIINEEKALSILNKKEQEETSYYDEINSSFLIKQPFYLSYDLIKEEKVTFVDTLVNYEEALDMASKEIANFGGSLYQIVKEITPRLNHSYVVLSLQNKEKIKRLKDFFLENLLPYKTIDDLDEADISCINFINQEMLSIDLIDANMLILDENTLFPTRREKKKIRYQSSFKEAEKITDHLELKIGDYIVHLNHGIGLYEGIKTIELSGRKRDYLCLKYALDERVYIPIEQLSMIKKYIGSEGKKPSLSNLNTNAWKKAKERVKSKILDISDKLIKLYTQREQAIGFACSKDTDDQILFDADFAYIETDDQKKAIEEVKKDMEMNKPMDRLICGDVGYGKTEVALRAAFKAVSNGKQVAYLAPTTILTRQHYFTFKERMEKYGVRVELLNRFTSSKDAKKILKDLAFGIVDVLIGTHRILSDDVKFKDLGLLITDEEQRFGVLHKEKIKEMRVNVDSLMLSATPIPRTLQMSLVGIKDLSLIETPPQNRYPIQTYVTPRKDSIVKEAIERELIRGGQIFYLYNYTEDIIDVAHHLAKLVPEARICYAHGKMNKNELEKTVSAFIDHEYDILVSTTIIETGIDIPEANTLIIHDSDRLGLSQLYQIRGRVGRSDKIAYAYLMYEPRKILTIDAEKRLEAIKEFTELGSGFKIAMRDLSIRGAGDLLGSEQSGFIDSVGLDTYMQILDETLKELTNKDEKKIDNNYVSTKVLADRFIPEKYQLDEDLKIEIHQKISNVKSLHDVSDLIMEFNDRFGNVDESLEIYMYEKLFNYYSKAKHFKHVDYKPNMITIIIDPEFSQNLNGEEVFKNAYLTDKNILISYKDSSFYIYFKILSYPNGTWLKPICRFLSKIKS